MRTALKSWFLNSGGENVFFKYLTENAFAFWDFTDLFYSSGDTIELVSDKSTTGINLANASPATTPNLILRQVASNQIKTYRAENPTDFLLLNNFLNSVVNVDHEIIWVVNPTNSSPHIIGSTQASPLHNWRIYFVGGKLKWQFRASGFNSTYDADNVAISTSGEGFSVWRLKVDFTNDILKLWKNGVEQALTLTSGTSFNAINPAGWTANATYPGFGTNNLGGTLSTTTAPYYFTKAAITPILTEEIAAGIQNLFTP